MRYATVVADPPWAHKRTGWTPGDKHWMGNRKGQPKDTEVPYPVLSVEEIAALPVADLAAKDAHLYLWTTAMFLRSAFDIAEAWGFTVSAPLVWCKASKGFFGGTFTSNVEFVLFCRRGSLPTNDKINTRWFTWERLAHSQKPEAFMDIVERVSPGPYLELFARRNRLGWDTWGNESLEHVAI